MESPPPLARYISPKKRVFPGSSSSYMDAEVVEIPPPIFWNSKSKSKSAKPKEAFHVEIIDIDMDEDSGDVMLIDEKVNQSNKGKEALVDLSCGSPVSVDGVQSSKKSSFPGSNDPWKPEDFSNEFSYGDEYIDLYHDDLTYDDEYTFLQAHFDNIDIPPGVEAPIPWFSDSVMNKKNKATASNSNHSSFPIQEDAIAIDSHFLGMQKHEQKKRRSTFRGSLMQTHLHTPSHSQGVYLSLCKSKLLSASALQKKNLASSESATDSHSLGMQIHEQNGGRSTSIGSSMQTHLDTPIHSEGEHLSLRRSISEFSRQKKKIAGSIERSPKDTQSGSKSWCIPGFAHGKKTHAVSDSINNYTSQNQPGATKLQSTIDPSLHGPNNLNSNEKYGNNSLTYSWFSAMETPNFPFGADAFMSGWESMYNSSDAAYVFPRNEAYISHVQGPVSNQSCATASGSSTVQFGSSTSVQNLANDKDLMMRFQQFKQFDTAQDHSDHYFCSKVSSVNQPPKNWQKKIQDEWRILEKGLPDTIFVRVYESRMDLLRAVIVGAEGTPYHDGLFFFDVFFPTGYPNVPPHVHYHSGGLRINPNLYNCGKVCLSLLNTWSGNKNEKWIPGRSTMLQVLVSIQALILNAKPYFNEPGYASMSGSASGEKNSQQYNENTFILSLKTMMYTIKRPPKHFEDFVVGHFCKHAQDILVACKAYMEGVQVGCLVKGGVQDVDAGGKSCSQNFRDSLASIITGLVQSFSQLGVEDCDRFLSLAAKGSSQPHQVLMPSNNQFPQLNPTFQTTVIYPYP